MCGLSSAGGGYAVTRQIKVDVMPSRMQYQQWERCTARTLPTLLLLGQSSRPLNISLYILRSAQDKGRWKLTFAISLALASTISFLLCHRHRTGHVRGAS
jgi:hypothetical protein